MIKKKIHIRKMGSDFELTVVEKDEETADIRLQEGISEIQRIEDSLTEFSETSETARINHNAGTTATAVTAEVYLLIQRCIRLSALTQGAFDISSGSLKSLYNFKEKGTRIPSPEQLRATLRTVGYRHIQLLAGNKVFLTRPGMHIGFGAIGKGYAADKVRTLWQAKGVTSGVINASGDLTAWGRQPDGSPWKIGVADPREPSLARLWFPVENAAVATSGNYEQYVEIDNIRYSHNIDPRSGKPVRGVKSVTIVSPSAELSDALATAVTVMGRDAGLDLIDQIPGTYGILIDETDRIFTSKKIVAHVNPYSQVNA
jgi:thiamine biosynthesis lipoprotein